MRRRILLMCWILLMGKAALSQLQITYNGKEINYSNAGIQYTLTAQNNFSQTTLAAIQQSDWQNLPGNKIQTSNLSKSVWLKIPVNSLLRYGHFNFININNPHINYLQCWIARQDSIVQTFGRTGDNMPFSTRPLATTSFVYGVNGANYQDCDFIIATDKRYTKLDLPVEFSTEAYFLQQSLTQNLRTGLFLGIGIFLVIFNLYLFISIRQSLYCWYFLYALTIIIYLGTDIGLLFKYLYPNTPAVNDVIRPAVFALSILPLLNFFNALLNIKNELPWLYRFNKRLAIGFIILFVVAVSTSATGNFKMQGMWVYINRIVSPLLLVILLSEALYCFIKKLRYAIFTLVSFLGFTIFIVIYALQQGLAIVQNDFTSAAHYLGLFFEAMVMAFALAWRFKFYKEDSERLFKENQQQQENIFKEISIYQEKEMLRMSSMLHDNLGANIGLLRLEADNMPLTEDARSRIASHITQIGNEVRTMSHSFSPALLKDKGLRHAIAENVKFITTNSRMDLQFEWIGESSFITFQNEVIIYRMVQEILQNLLKHAKASNAFLQIIAEKNLISIYAEDDGVGFTGEPGPVGLGFNSIKKLVSILKGNFNVESDGSNGFSISIEFNLIGNEKN